MIFKLTFEDGRIEWFTAKSQLHLLQSYDTEFDLRLQEIESIEEISDEAAKTIMVKNNEVDEFIDGEIKSISLFDISVGHDFAIIASTEEF